MNMISWCVHTFDPEPPGAEAPAPPSGWRLDQEFQTHELRPVFRRNWLALGNAQVVMAPGQCFQVEVAEELFPVAGASMAFVGESLARRQRDPMTEMATVQSTREGLRFPISDTGRYAPTLEHALHDIRQSLIAELLR